MADEDENSNQSASQRTLLTRSRKRELHLVENAVVNVDPNVSAEDLIRLIEESTEAAPIIVNLPSDFRSIPDVHPVSNTFSLSDACDEDDIVEEAMMQVEPIDQRHKDSTVTTVNISDVEVTTDTESMPSEGTSRQGPDPDDSSIEARRARRSMAASGPRKKKSNV